MTQFSNAARSELQLAGTMFSDTSWIRFNADMSSGQTVPTMPKLPRSHTYQDRLDHLLMSQLWSCEY